MIDYIVENIKFLMALIRYGDMTKNVLVFSVNVSESVCLSGKGIEKKKTVCFIFLNIPRLGKIQSFQ